MPTTLRSDFLREIAWRGFLQQASDLEALDKLLHERKLVAYIGFDCTAPSMHVGSLLPIMLLRWFQKTGHQPIVLMGGGTTKVGDPSGRDAGRRLLTTRQISSHQTSLSSVFARFLEFGDGKALLLDNAVWLDKLGYIDFLRDLGRHFSVNRMLTMDSVRTRLERQHPLSLLEFNYMALQAYDFLELYRSYGCRIQMGGSDQWGNIVAGIDLTRRCLGAQLFGLTAPLIVTSSGSKMGKTAQGAVWLNPDSLPTWQYWQYWRNTRDADVGRFLRLFTDLPHAEILRLEKLEGRERNAAKIALANAATALCRGTQEADAAARTAHEAFVERQKDAEGLPQITLFPKDLTQGMHLYRLLRFAGLTESHGQARRLMHAGGVRVDDRVRTDAETLMTIADWKQENVVKLSVGKKRHMLVRLSR